MLTSERMANIVLQSPRTREVYSAVRNELFRQYIGTELGSIPDCFIPELYSDFSEVIPMGQVPLQITLDHSTLLINYLKLKDVIVQIT